MSEAKLDQIVKGAPPPNISPSQIAAAATATSSPPRETLDHPPPPPPPTTTNGTTNGTTNDTRSGTHTPLAPSDPLSTLPSSPPQIYLNLLILEASLRAQYLVLRARRRRHLFVLALLAAWTAYFTYALFLRPRDDGQGFGGSVYWMVEISERIALMGGVLTLLLIWATGVWERGVRWPRRWVGVTNRGLRGVNAKIVVLRRAWWREMVGHLWFLMPWGVHVWGAGDGMGAPGSEYRVVEREEGRKAQGDVLREYGASATGAGAMQAKAALEAKGGAVMVEEDVAPGGDHIKLLLLPKPFSPDFRENWELYRTEYWERENERRANLRALLRQKEKEIAKREGGWLWWTGWRGWKNFRGGAKSASLDQEKQHTHGHPHTHHLRAGSSLKEKRRRPSVIREGSHSRSSSKSNTPTPELDEEYGRTVRRGSSSSARGERVRRKSGSTGERPKIRGLTPSNSRPGTPNASSTENKRLSTLSIASEGRDDGDLILEDRENKKVRGLPPIAGSPIKREEIADD